MFPLSDLQEILHTPRTPISKNFDIVWSNSACYVKTYDVISDVTFDFETMGHAEGHSAAIFAPIGFIFGMEEVLGRVYTHVS